MLPSRGCLLLLISLKVIFDMAKKYIVVDDKQKYIVVNKTTLLNIINDGIWHRLTISKSK